MLQYLKSQLLIKMSSYISWRKLSPYIKWWRILESNVGAKTYVFVKATIPQNRSILFRFSQPHHFMLTRSRARPLPPKFEPGWWWFVTCESAFRVAGVGLCGTQAKVALRALMASSPLPMGEVRKGDGLWCVKVHWAWQPWGLELWSAECEVWRVKCEVWWSVQCGVWTVACEVWNVGCGVRSLECEVWSTKCGVQVWGVMCEVWNVMWNVMCEVWSVKCGVWGVKCAVWSVKCAVSGVQFQVCSVKCGVWREVSLWSVKCTVWSVECVVWSQECEVCSMKCGVWSVECDVWSVMWSARCGVESVKWGAKCGVWSVECAVWSVGCEVCSVKCAVWSVECGVWSVQCGVWSVACEVWSVKCEDRVWSAKYAASSSVKYEVGSVKLTVWSAECRVGSLKCVVWSVACEVWSGTMRRVAFEILAQGFTLVYIFMPHMSHMGKGAAKLSRNMAAAAVWLVRHTWGLRWRYPLWYAGCLGWPCSCLLLRFHRCFGVAAVHTCDVGVQICRIKSAVLRLFFARGKETQLEMLHAFHQELPENPIVCCNSVEMRRVSRDAGTAGAFQFEEQTMMWTLNQHIL